jgi:hypothetical protein
MNRSLKIFVACALGGGIGTFVALQLTSSFWWIGLIAGGFVGYISYDVKAIIPAAQESWRRTSHYFGNEQKRAKFFWVLTALVSFLSSVAAFAFVACIVNPRFRHEDPHSLLVITTIFVVATIIGLCFRSMMQFDANTVKVAKRLALFLSPPAYLIYWPYKLAEAFVLEFLLPFYDIAREMIKGLPSATIGLCKFVWTIFVLIHSEVRLLCMLDAAIGAGLGYYFGSALIGAMAGGAFGVFNFQVISKWWLKLVPER